MLTPADGQRWRRKAGSRPRQLVALAGDRGITRRMRGAPAHEHSFTRLSGSVPSTRWETIAVGPGSRDLSSIFHGGISVQEDEALHRARDGLGVGTATAQRSQKTGGVTITGRTSSGPNRTESPSSDHPPGNERTASSDREVLRSVTADGQARCRRRQQRVRVVAAVSLRDSRQFDAGLVNGRRMTTYGG